MNCVHDIEENARWTGALLKNCAICNRRKLYAKKMYRCIACGGYVHKRCATRRDGSYVGSSAAVVAANGIEEIAPTTAAVDVDEDERVATGHLAPSSGHSGDGSSNVECHSAAGPIVVGHAITVCLSATTDRDDCHVENADVPVVETRGVDETESSPVAAVEIPEGKSVNETFGDEQNVVSSAAGITDPADRMIDTETKGEETVVVTATAVVKIAGDNDHIETPRHEVTESKIDEIPNVPSTRSAASRRNARRRAQKKAAKTSATTPIDRSVPAATVATSGMDTIVPSGKVEPAEPTTEVPVTVDGVRSGHLSAASTDVPSTLSAASRKNARRRANKRNKAANDQTTPSTTDLVVPSEVYMATSRTATVLGWISLFGNNDTSFSGTSATASLVAESGTAAPNECPAVVDVESSSAGAPETIEEPVSAEVLSVTSAAARSETPPPPAALTDNIDSTARVAGEIVPAPVVVPTSVVIPNPVVVPAPACVDIFDCFEDTIVPLGVIEPAEPTVVTATAEIPVTDDVVVPTSIVLPAPVVIPEPVTVPVPIVVPTPVAVSAQLFVSAPVDVPVPIVVPAPETIPAPTAVPTSVVVPTPIVIPAPVTAPVPVEVPAPVVVPAPVAVPAPARVDIFEHHEDDIFSRLKKSRNPWKAELLNSRKFHKSKISLVDFVGKIETQEGLTLYYDNVSSGRSVDQVTVELVVSPDVDYWYQGSGDTFEAAQEMAAFYFLASLHNMLKKN